MLPKCGTPFGFCSICAPKFVPLEGSPCSASSATARSAWYSNPLSLSGGRSLIVLPVGASTSAAYMPKELLRKAGRKQPTTIRSWAPRQFSANPEKSPPAHHRNSIADDRNAADIGSTATVLAEPPRPHPGRALQGGKGEPTPRTRPMRSRNHVAVRACRGGSSRVMVERNAP